MMDLSQWQWRKKAVVMDPYGTHLHYGLFINTINTCWDLDIWVNKNLSTWWQNRTCCLCGLRIYEVLLTIFVSSQLFWYSCLFLLKIYEHREFFKISQTLDLNSSCLVLTLSKIFQWEDLSSCKFKWIFFGCCIWNLIFYVNYLSIWQL